jgi:hypothetical protein
VAAIGSTNEASGDMINIPINGKFTAEIPFRSYPNIFINTCPPCLVVGSISILEAIPMPDKEYWAVTETSYRAVSGPESLVEGETLVEGHARLSLILDNLNTQHEQRTKADAIIESLQEAVDVDLGE